jgi:hypothetical protein
MPETTRTVEQAEQFAKQIDAAVKAKRADDAAKAQGEQLDKLLKGVTDLTATCGEITRRLDALEARRGEPGDGKHLPMHGSKHRGATPQGDDDDDNDNDNDDTHDIEEKRAGKPKPVAADATDGVRSRREEKITAAWSRAEQAHQLWGNHRGAPSAMPGESSLAYRKRLLQPFLRFSRSGFDGVDLKNVDATMLGGLENSVYADAAAAASSPEFGAPEGTLRAVRKKDDTGRVITEWVGEPRAWMSQFSGVRRRVIGFRNVSTNP